MGGEYSVGVKYASSDMMFEVPFFYVTKPFFGGIAKAKTAKHQYARLNKRTDLYAVHPLNGGVLRREGEHFVKKMADWLEGT